LERLEVERWLPPAWAVDLDRDEARARVRRERPRKRDPSKREQQIRDNHESIQATLARVRAERNKS
jgi:hypothetical protein